MLLFEIIRILAVVTIGILMFVGLFHIQERLGGIRPLRKTPLRKRGREGKQPDKGAAGAIIITYTIIQLIITAMLFLLIRLILRGEL